MDGSSSSSAASLIKILLDLGPSITSSVGTLRESLRLVTQKLPPNSIADGSSQNGLEMWKEEGVARLLHFLSAVASSPPLSVSAGKDGRGQGGEEKSLSAAFVGTFLNNPDMASNTGVDADAGAQGGGWNVEVISQIFAGGDFAHLDWNAVATSLDFPEFKVRDGRHLEALLGLYRAGRTSSVPAGGSKDPQDSQLPLDVATSAWDNRQGQLSLLEHLLVCPQTVYSFHTLSSEEILDASTVVVDGKVVATNCPNPQGWASAAVLQRLLHLSDDRALHPKVRDIFVVGLLSCPEIILCALVRLQLSVATKAGGGDNGGGDGSEASKAEAAKNAGAGMPMKGELMRELIPLFFKPQGGAAGGAGASPANVVRNMPGALCRLWSISQNTVVAACIEAWRSTGSDPPSVRFATVVHIINVVRILPSPENAIATLLNGNKDMEFSFTVAFVMADHDMLQLRPWLNDRWNAATSAGGGQGGGPQQGGNRTMFVVALISYVGKNYNQAAPRRNKPLVSVENLGTTLQFVVALDNETLGGAIPHPSGKVVTLGESVKAVVDACVARHPSLGEALGNTYSIAGASSTDATGGGILAGGGAGNAGNQQQRAAPGSQDDIEECANQYFQQIYASEESARKVVEMLKSFKASGNSRENDIFACMIHNLFDEYRFFSKYPEKELRITGILFGLLIKEQLVSSITLGIALRYVLEALRKPPAQSPQSGKMFRFGMFALEQFKERLHEWPQYCSHIVQIPHLREGYASLVAEIEGAVLEDGGNSVAGSSISTGGAAVGGIAPSTNNASTADAASLARSADSGIEGSGSLPGSNALGGGVVLGGEITVPTASAVSNIPIGGFVGAGSASTSGAAGAFSVNARAGAALPTIPLKDSKPRKAVFGPGLGRAVNPPAAASTASGGDGSTANSEGNEKSASSSEPSQSANVNEAPPDVILDRVQFLINNLSMSNVEHKSHDLREMLERKYFGWLGNYLVVKRISTQPNFHALYLSFLDNLGMDYGRGLVEAILASVYVNVGKLLRSQKITTSTSERSLLKNLGSWLGQITLARNRPILQIMLDCKELLFQGYETGMLIAVTPFVAKILEGAKNSSVFRPPNPWLMGLLGVFRALYDVEDLKMNIKFEVEVLCKNLGLKLEDIPVSLHADLSRRIPPVKEKNPDFNLKSQSTASSAANTPAKGGVGQGLALQAANSMLTSPDNKSSGASTGGDSAKSSDAGDNEQQQTVIPNLANYVKVNSNLTHLFLQVQGGPLASNVTAELLNRSVPIAVDRAIREIIQPVVERSVSIALITTKAIVTKDFAMESDEMKMRKASQLMVANLAGSLALVTCREPLHTSISQHLRQLLLDAINSSGSNKESGVQLQDLEKSLLDQCVAICSTENLELGTVLIEKAATEKAVRDVDEQLAPALAIRKNSREQKGQPYYDMSIFSDTQRYPKELPDPLRPKPGGLRPEQLMVYEAFQRMPRQPSQQQPGGMEGSKGGFMGGSDGMEGDQRTGDASASTMGGSASGSGLNMNAINAIAVKLDSSVTTLLNTAGPRAQEISLAMIPTEHEIKQLISAVPRVVASANTNASGDDMSSGLSSSETDSVLSFSQGIFKRLYEVNLTERLRLEALIALLEMLNRICPQLGRDMGTWATYAPTKTDAQRKLHRAVLLLLVRSNLIKIGDLDGYLAKNADEGRDQVWLEFLILFVRTAVLENIAPPGKMPQMIHVVQLLAEDRSPISKEINPAFKKAAARLLEEIRSSLEASSGQETKHQQGQAQQPSFEESSSMSPASIKHLADASVVIAKSSQSFANADPPNAKQLVTEILVSWLRVQSDAAGNDKIMAQFLQRLQAQFGVGSNEDQTERFLRLATEVVAESCKQQQHQQQEAKQQQGLSYQAVDGCAKLFTYLVRYMNAGGSAEQVSQQRLTLLNKVLGVITRSLVTSYQKAQQSNAVWDQRPYFRLLLDLVCELNRPDPVLDPIKGGIVSVFGSAFHVVQPLVVPGFAFAWLELISHRMFLSNLLLTKDQKGWGIMHQLLIDLFLFLEPHLRKVELTEAIKKYYDGSLRVLLMLVHDFPTFLAAYHLSFCNIIPDNCVQLRNLILSAIPKGIPLHDPISRNFKIDQLPEIAQSPLILSNVAGPLGLFKGELDGYLRSQQPADFLTNMVSSHLLKESKNEVDAPKVNSLVLYVGMQGLQRLQNDQIASGLGRSPEMEVFQKLMELDDYGRYMSLNAIANQLRYPSSHTHYFSCVMLYLFNENKSEAVKEQITRVLLERLITQRPHPWGLLITFIELIKNTKYQFWSHPFTRCSSEIEKVFENVARSCMLPSGVATSEEAQQ